MNTEQMKAHVIEAATKHFHEGHSMAGSYYEIDEALGELYSATQKSLMPTVPVDYDLAWYEEQDDMRYSSGPYYRDANGIEHESYEAACHYYGVDTPAQVEAEGRYYAQIAYIEHQDAMEAAGGPIYQFSGYGIDEIPF